MSNVIDRLIECVVPVMVPSASNMKRIRDSKPWAKQDDKKEVPKPADKKEGPTQDKHKKLGEDLKAIAESISADEQLKHYAPHILKMAETVCDKALIPFEGNITVSNTTNTDVITQKMPPEKDPVLAAILGKSRPHIDPIVQVQNQDKDGANSGAQKPVEDPEQLKKQQQNNILRAMEDAAAGKPLAPKTELVESTSMANAQSMLGIPSAGNAIPASSIPTGNSKGAFTAFAKFVR